MGYAQDIPNIQEKRKPGYPGLLHVVLLLELVYASAGVHQLLLAGKERMAAGADFDVEVIFG
jgi:hypothetical protein